MPRSKRPSFLTKLKEQQRRARADEKREARRARQRAKADRTRQVEAAPEAPVPLPSDE
jgi:hypothetical protein